MIGLSGENDMNYWNRAAHSLYMILVLVLCGFAAQDDSLPVIPFAAIRDDALWLFGFSDEPKQVEIVIEPGSRPHEIHRRPLVWSADGQHLYFTLDHTRRTQDEFGYEEFFPIMRTDRAGTPAEIVVQQTSFWYGTDYVDGNLIYAQFNEDARYPEIEIAPYSSDANTIFAPVQHDVYSIAADGSGRPDLLGYYPQGVDCQGGPLNLSELIYHGELNWRGNPLTLRLTPYGIVHTFTCWGGGIAILETNNVRDRLIGNFLRRVQISPDGREMIGIDDARPDTRTRVDETLLRYVNLETLETEIIPTSGQPDQVAWGATGTRDVFYSVVTPAGKIELTEEEAALIDEITVFFGDGAMQAASIRRYNLDTGEDVEVYSADAYAVGRMTITPDNKYLLFSQIPNADAWVEAALASEDPFAEGAVDSFYEQIEPRLYLLDLQTGEMTLIAERVYWFSLNAPAYLEALEP